MIHISFLFFLGVVVGQTAFAHQVLVHFGHPDKIVANSNLLAEAQRRVETSQNSVRVLLEREGLKYRSYSVSNTIVVDGANEDVQRLLRNVPGVKSVRADRPFRLIEVPAAAKSYPPASMIPESIESIRVDKVWSDLGVKGQGVVVAGIDTGAEWNHEAIKSRYRGNGAGVLEHRFSWHDATRGKAEPYDDHGHGTHTIGTMVGEQVGRDRFGVAPDAKWIACRAFERARGTVARFLDCMQFMLAPGGRPELAPHILNLSWSCGEPEDCHKGDELADAIRLLKAAGIAVVVSAGNNGSACGTVFFAPVFYTGDVISVGSFDHRDGSISSFSSRGPSSWDGGLAPTVTGPGDFIRSAVPGGYGFKTGTSMASPHVAGVIALLWSAKPSLIGDIDGTRDLLQRTAQPKLASQSCGSFPGNRVPNAVWGFGVIDALAAASAP